MKIAVASDHRGFHVKGKILDLLTNMGHETIDFGTDGEGGMYGTLKSPMPAVDFSRKVTEVLEREVLHIGDGDQQIQTLRAQALIRNPHERYRKCEETVGTTVHLTQQECRQKNIPQ